MEYILRLCGRHLHSSGAEIPKYDIGTHTVETLCNKVGLSVNPDKTGLVAFKRRRKLLGFLESHLFGITLRRSVSVKHLGVVRDSRLTWREHVDVKVRKAHNLLWACRRANGMTWGLRPKVVHWL